MIPVKKSALAPYFDEIQDTDLQGVQILSPVEAKKVWAEYFDLRAKGFYDLSNDSWVARNSWSVIGNWIDAYNALTDRREIENLIIKASNWSIDEPLVFVQNSQQAVALTLLDFLKYWQDLLAAFDDGPILMAQNEEVKTAIRFIPLGQVILTKRN